MAPESSAERQPGLFLRMYRWTLRLSGHRRAPFWLGTVSFAESSFFPIPPDVMLAPMTLARPKRWWYFALLTTVTSVAGGMVGYLIGIWLIEAIMPWLERAGQLPTYFTAKEWFARWGIWAMFLAGFTPIPFKIFTIAAGSVGLAMPAFLIGATLGRGLRFFIVAGVVRAVGPAAMPWLERYLERIGWTLVVLTVLALIWTGMR